MSTILVTGASQGLGLQLYQNLTEAGHSVIPFNKEMDQDVRLANLPKKLHQLDVLINNAGVNEISWLDDMEDASWNRVMDTNAKGIYLMTKACLPMLRVSRGTVLNIVSNASHMPMTCSLAYNASKAAAHMMTLQMARELTKRYGITVFGISPNKLAGTGMSNYIEKQVLKTRGWTAEYARQYQLNALLTGEETPPSLVAKFITFLLTNKDNHRFLSGCIIPYGA